VGKRRKNSRAESSKESSSSSSSDEERPQMKLKRRGRFLSFSSSYVNLACLGEYKRDQ
jgi:hypothetical protein